MTAVSPSQSTHWISEHPIYHTPPQNVREDNLSPTYHLPISPTVCTISQPTLHTTMPDSRLVSGWGNRLPAFWAVSALGEESDRSIDWGFLQ
jgi:hypothetical protein